MKKYRYTTLFGLACAMVSGTSLAQELNIQNWQPVSPGDAQLIGVHSTTQAAAFKPAFGLSLSFLDDPLVLENDDGERVSSLVDHRLESVLSVAMGVGKGFEVSAMIPLILSQKSQGFEDLSTTQNDSGFGDLRLVARYRLPKRFGGFNVGARLEALLPTASNVPFAGNSGLSVAPSVIADWSKNNVLVSANLGLRIRSAEAIGDLEVGSALTMGVGAAYPLPSLPLTLIGEFAAEWAGNSTTKTPIELRAGVRLPVFSKVDLLAGYGHGFVSGYGAPDHHLFMMASFPRAQTKNKRLGAPIAGQTSNSDLDGDGIIDTDQCPVDPEDFDGFQDQDGCPDPDNDFDGILDGDDMCPIQSEIINGIDDDDGCPDQGRRLVVVGSFKIEIQERLFFANNRDEILPRSEPVLRQLAKTINRMPWLKSIRIEGHTDERGDTASNKDLSQRRADSVRRALIALKVDGSRLVATGYGEEQPIDNNSTLNGRANNRRVEFVILEQTAPPKGWNPPPEMSQEATWNSNKETN